MSEKGENNGVVWNGEKKSKEKGKMRGQGRLKKDMNEKGKLLEMETYS